MPINILACTSATLLENTRGKIWIFWKNVKICPGLQKYNNIKKIELNYLINLTDITTLNSLRNIQFLEIESCKKALDVEVLSNIAYLHTLKLTNCGVLDNLNFIQDLKRLKFFTFIDTKLKSGDLTPLTCHPSLEYAGFMSSRDYNYSFDQIQEMLHKKK